MRINPILDAADRSKKRKTELTMSSKLIICMIRFNKDAKYLVPVFLG